MRTISAETGNTKDLWGDLGNGFYRNYVLKPVDITRRQLLPNSTVSGYPRFQVVRER